MPSTWRISKTSESCCGNSASASVTASRCSRRASASLGDQGILLASALGGLASTSAVALSISGLLAQGSLSPFLAAEAVLAAIAAGAAAKWVLTLLNGTRQMAFWLGGGLLTMLATAFLVLFAQP